MKRPLTATLFAAMLVRLQTAAAQPPLPPFGVEATRLAPAVRLLDFDAPKAAPAVGDVDGDGLWDVVVGNYPTSQYQDGRFRYYRNVGTSDAPRFGAGEWLHAGADLMGVPRCCVTGAGPQVVDFDGDGLTDIVSAAACGELFVFPGRGGGAFGEREIVRYVAEERQASLFTYSTRAHVVDWDADGDLDLLVGAPRGISFIQNTGTRRWPRYVEAVTLTAEGRPLDLQSASLLVVDWNGDGKRDLLGGGADGSVLWYPNTADTGPPVLAAPLQLVPPSELGRATRPLGKPYQPPASPGHHARVAVADVDGDGLLDLLLGDSFYVSLAPPELTAEERLAIHEARKKEYLKWEQLRTEFTALRSAPRGETDADRLAREKALRAKGAECFRAESAMPTFPTGQSEHHGFVWWLRRLP